MDWGEIESVLIEVYRWNAKIYACISYWLQNVKKSEGFALANKKLVIYTTRVEAKFIAPHTLPQNGSGLVFHHTPWEPCMMNDESG